MSAPEGFNTVTPMIAVENAEKAIESWKACLGLIEHGRLECPQSGKVLHACLEIPASGNIPGSRIFACDANPDWGYPVCQNMNFYVYSQDAEQAFNQAIQNGMNEVQPVSEQFWGDKMGSVKDSCGITWSLAQKVRDVSPEEMQKAIKEMAESAAA